MNADLDLHRIDMAMLGRELYDIVCRAIGLREIWYFGLQYLNKKQIRCWLQMDRPLNKQDVPRQDDGSLHFLFLVKFYPEDVDEELIQDVTRHLFFLQIKQCILNMDLYCSPEASVLLASYAVQAMYGDCDDNIALELSKLLPQGVLDQYEMTPEMWEERIRRWWANNEARSREDAEMEYLKIAQDLDMYGIQYFPICNKKDTDLHLGVSAQGIGIYKGTDRMTPLPFFQWSEIKNISFKNKKFYIRTADKSALMTFRSLDMSINKTILDLCIGAHNLYLRRRQPDSLEVQQMKVQAKEERARRQQEQARLEQEKEIRSEMERERDQLKSDLNNMNEQLTGVQSAMRRTEETAELLAEKARVSEEEALVLSKRASEAEAECQRIKIAQIKAEETKMALERKARDAELMTARLLEETDRSPISSPMHAQSHPMLDYDYPMPYPAYMTGASSSYLSAGHIPPDPIAGTSFGADIGSLKEAIEKERTEYNQKSHHLQEQLGDLRREIDSLKLEGRQTEHDIIHEQNLQTGDDRRSTIRKNSAGTMQARIKQFEGL